MGSEQYWLPNLSNKQIEIFNIGTQEDAGTVHPDCPAALMVSGPRKTGKTLGVCHRVCRHLWETPGARVALISKTIRSMTDGGIWQDLTEIVMPEWISANIGFQFTTSDRDGNPGPVRDSTTRTILFRVRNMHGGESELRLVSIEHDFEVKAKLKQSRWSLVWFSELALFTDPDVFRTSMMQLRMVHLFSWQHLWIADTNPSEEGEDHWAYQLWYKRRLTKQQEIFSKSIRLIEIFLEDNPFLTQGQIEFQKSLYADDPGEYEREVLGKWTKGHGTRGKHFADIFSRNLHIVGGGDGEGDTIDVSPDAETLYSGWDLGQVNHAAVILEKRVVKNGDRELPVWCVLDSLLYLGEQMTIQDFTIEFMACMKRIEDKEKKKFQWVHWSDDSALNVFRPTGATFDYLEVQIASKGAINLIGVAKPDGSVKTRVRLLRRLLRERRIYVSSRCAPVIECLEECRHGSTERDYVEWNKQKHIFDCLTYPIFMESTEELYELTKRPTASSDATLTSLQLA